MIKLNSEQIDALKEIGNIGAGHAALALSQLIGERINIAVTKVEVVPSDEFSEFAGGPNTLGAVIYFQILGDLKGTAFLFFKREDAIGLIEVLLHKEKGKTIALSEIGISALKEASNILVASCLSAMSQVVPFRLALSIPKFTFDHIGYAVEGVFDELMPEEKKCISVITEFAELGKQIKGCFVFTPQNESLDKILKGLKVKE